MGCGKSKPLSQTGSASQMASGSKCLSGSKSLNAQEFPGGSLRSRPPTRGQADWEPPARPEVLVHARDNAAMAKDNKTIYTCSECGGTSAKWLGKCPHCNAWNTLEESVAESAAATRHRASDRTRH